MSMNPINGISPAPERVMTDYARTSSKKAEDAAAKQDTGTGKGLHHKPVEEIAAEAQILLKRLNTELRLEVDDNSGNVIVKIVDPDTDKVIRQVPSEELLSIRERMQELIGVLYSVKT